MESIISVQYLFDDLRVAYILFTYYVSFQLFQWNWYKIINIKARLKLALKRCTFKLEIKKVHV